MNWPLGASQVALVVNPPANVGDVRNMGSTLGWEDPLEKGIATHSSILAWRIPRREEPGGYSPWGHRRFDTMEETEHTKQIRRCKRMREFFFSCEHRCGYLGRP